MPQDGHDKQDCERAAGKRWLTKHAPQVAPQGVTLLGDDLYSNQPLCALALQEGSNFIFVCKPDSHVQFYERLAFWQANDGLVQLENRLSSPCWPLSATEDGDQNPRRPYESKF